MASRDTVAQAGAPAPLLREGTIPPGGRSVLHGGVHSAGIINPR